MAQVEENVVTIRFKVTDGKVKDRAIQVAKWYFAIEDVPVSEEDTFVDEFFESLSGIRAE